MIHLVDVDREVYGRLIAVYRDPGPGELNDDALLLGQPWVEIPIDDLLWVDVEACKQPGETTNDVLRRRLGLPPLQPLDDR